jgi:isochorismate synthase
VTHAPTLPLDALAQRLRSLLAEGRETASRDRPVLVSTAVPVLPVDAVELFGKATGERFLWEHPSEGFSLLGLGAAARIAASGAESLGQVAGRWRELAARTITETLEPLPLSAPVGLGCFAFDPSRDGGGEWAGFPDALLTVPRLLIVADRDSSSLIVSTLATADCEPEDATSAIVTDIRHALAEAEVDARRDQHWGEVTLDGEGRPGRWQSAVRDALRDIQGSAVEKVVLARRVTAHAEGPIEATAVLRRLREGYPQCAVFACAQGDACFLGATPERLVRLDGRTVRADPLAGSAPRGASEDEDRRLGDALLADEKERREHALVVEAIRDALAPLCVHLTVPERPSLLRMPNVQHLDTHIEGVLGDDTTILELAARLHPTPAAGGLPRDAALSLIRRYEPFDRGCYAGPVGWMDGAGDGEFAVAIRSALLRGDEALLYAGCGIVAGSDPEREYNESCLKLKPMLWALNGKSS